MEFLCAECIHNQSVTGNEPKPAVTLIDGYATCMGHAKVVMARLGESRKKFGWAPAPEGHLPRQD